MIVIHRKGTNPLPTAEYTVSEMDKDTLFNYLIIEKKLPSFWAKRVSAHITKRKNIVYVAHGFNSLPDKYKQAIHLCSLENFIAITNDTDNENELYVLSSLSIDYNNQIQFWLYEFCDYKLPDNCKPYFRNKFIDTILKNL